MTCDSILEYICYFYSHNIKKQSFRMSADKLVTRTQLGIAIIAITITVLSMTFSVGQKIENHDIRLSHVEQTQEADRLTSQEANRQILQNLSDVEKKIDALILKMINM